MSWEGYGKRGVSLIEMMVVLAILSMLIAILLPAVVSVRESARRASCSNKQRQLALALQLHHNAVGSLPAGNRFRLPVHDQSWIVPALVYADMPQPYISSLGEYERTLNYEFHEYFSRPVPLLICPSDVRNSGAGFYMKSFLLCGLTSYLGVNGKNFRDKSGVLFYQSQVRFADITDGLSHTLMIGERPPALQTRFGWWYAGGGFGSPGTIDHVLGVMETVVLPEEEPCPNLGSLPRFPKSFSDCDSRHFWSFHPGGLHFALVDGSVRFVTYSGAPILEPMSTRAEGENIDLSAL